MSNALPAEDPVQDGIDPPASPAVIETAALQLHAEAIAVSKRRVSGDTVRVTARTKTREVVVNEKLSNETVVVERVPVGRYVEAAPDIRYEGDVTIMPVLEEEVVVTRRLFLREEVHVRRQRITVPHTESVMLREQEVVVTRASPQPSRPPNLAGAGVEFVPTRPIRSMPMESETIVAVYDTAAHAELAANDLRQAGVPDTAISLHTSASMSTSTVAGQTHEKGFWASLFGGDTAEDNTVYDRSLASGSTVVTVKAPDTHVTKVMEILESHHPVDIDERATGYGLTSGSSTIGSAGMGTMSTADTTATASTMGTAGYAAPATTGLGNEAGTIQLAEESLAVGKRLVNRGGTRIRRYVVETPVEESVSLHSETVKLERHPVTDGRPVTDASFSEKTIEMMESAEEAVVSKTARVVEEVGLRKEATDRVETIRDTVRKEEVEIEQVPGTATTTTTTPGTFTTPKV